MTEEIYFTCPHCHSKNKVPNDRDVRLAKCGQCHEKIRDGTIAETNATQLEKHLNQNGLAIIVDFWADWRAPCQAMTPIFKQLASDLETKLRFIKVDTDKEQKLAGKFQIRGLPTFVILNPIVA